MTDTASEMLEQDARATAPAAVTRERYRPELDGIRALCIIFTILEHVGGKPWWINGSIGVDCFFALSGWLITSLMIREHQNQGAVSLRNFYIRRIFRIAPLYYLTAIIYIVSALAGAKATGSAELKHAFAYMMTMCMEYRPAAAGNLFGHAWTLGIEEKFYLIWPLIFATTIKRPILSGILALLALNTLFLVFGVTPLLFRGYCGLAFGAAFAILSLTRGPLPIARVGAAPFLILILLAYLASIFWPDPAIWNIVIAFSATFIIGSLWFGRSPATAAFLSVGPLPWLGRLTYAIYLVQSLCIRLAEMVLRSAKLPLNTFTIFIASYAIVILVAWMMHAAVEKPMIRFGKKLASDVRSGVKGLLRV